MRYWDASALVPLCVHAASTEALRSLAGESVLVTWAGSIVEVAAAIERRTRDGSLIRTGREAALATLRDLGATWLEITAIGPVRDRALRLLATHPLRAADALQLGAALLAVSDRPLGHEFVCIDARLRDAASREGFTVVPAAPA